jgi:hypothetical protein
LYDYINFLLQYEKFSAYAFVRVNFFVCVRREYSKSYRLRRIVMCKKLIYLTSFCFVLCVATTGWSDASNPSPEDGAIHESTWVSLSWQSSDLAVSFDIYLGENYDDVYHGTGNTFIGNQRSTMLVVGFPGFPYPNGLVPGTTYYWRIDEINALHPNSPWKGKVWSYTIPSRTAHNPEPPDGAQSVSPNVVLSWEPGFRAKLHAVYFGGNYNDINNASGGVPVGIATYNPGLLETGKTYYWRVDEFDGASTHKGEIWSFTVASESPDDLVKRTYYVDAINGDDRNNGFSTETAFATIQKGINTATDGDKVLVYPGLYHEGVEYMGKALIVQGVATSGAGVPVLQNPEDFAVSFYSGEGPDTVLQNFIIKDSFMGIFIAASSPTLSNLTIVSNRYGIEAYAGSEPDISNTILWYNTDGDLFGCRARYSCVERGGETNIWIDPLFVDPNNGDYHLRSERGRYWPEHDVWVLDKVTSPCVDGGNPEAKVLEEPMPNGGRINIGAYGGTPEASLSPSERGSRLSDRAFNPYPADGAVDVGKEVDLISLTWTAGLNAISHDVYFGTHIGTVVNADTSDRSDIYRGRQTITSYTPPEGVRLRSTPYYWRIDEVDSQGNITKGDVWTFMTIPPRPPKGRACFLGDTLVWIDGALMNISKVISGQPIAKVEYLTTTKTLIEKIEEHEGTFTCYDILLESGNCISVAECHYFMTESQRWISVQDLKKGIRLKTANGEIMIKNNHQEANGLYRDSFQSQD